MIPFLDTLATFFLSEVYFTPLSETSAGRTTAFNAVLFPFARYNVLPLSTYPAAFTLIPVLVTELSLAAAPPADVLLPAGDDDGVGACACP